LTIYILGPLALGSAVPAAKISAFVICFNRADVLATCLRALRFADELIVVDKSSTDASRTIAHAYADRIVVVRWTPTVEETRTLALSLCQHEWILFMDDDECLSATAGRRIRAELENPQAAIYEFARREYILGRHDERAYYWPEHHVRLFRRGAITFVGTVHAGIMHNSTHVARFPFDKGVFIRHLSNANVAGWIEKTNRYTSNPDRAGIKAGAEGLAAFGHQRIDHWFARTSDEATAGYPAAAALQRAVYDMVDGLKAWEDASGLEGAALLRQVCDQLDREQQTENESTPDMHIATELRTELAAANQNNATLSSELAAANQNNATLSSDLTAAQQSNRTLSADLASARQHIETLSAGLAATQERAVALLSHLKIAEQRTGDLEAALADVRRDLAAMQYSTSWRLTAGLRRLMIFLRGH
jgi:hypothetical protein